MSKKYSIHDWRRDNPLTRWRGERALLRSDVAVMTGLSLSTLANAEKGDATDETLARLSEALGIPAVTLRKQWDKWLARSPLVKK